MKQDVLIIGAGVIGATTALALAEAGCRVSLIDKHDALCRGASGANGGQLSYSYSEALASPQTLNSMPKLAFGRDSAFRFSPNIDPDYIRWGLKFLANCTTSSHRKNSVALLQLALESQQQLHQWMDRYEFDFSHRTAHKLQIFESRAALLAAQSQLQYKNQEGAEQRVVSLDELIQLEPAIAHIEADIVGAIYAPREEIGDVEAFVPQVIGHALQLGGGELHLGVELRDVRVRKGRCVAVDTTKGEMGFDHCIICAGYESSKLARKFSIHTGPIVPMAGYSLTYEIGPHGPNMSITDPMHKIVLGRLGNTLRVAGMADVGRVVKSPPEKRIAALRQLLHRRYPGFGRYDEPERTWAGMRPMTPNSQPIIGKTKLENVFMNTGHGMLGWTLAAGSARLLLRSFEPIST